MIIIKTNERMAVTTWERVSTPIFFAVFLILKIYLDKIFEIF